VDLPAELRFVECLEPFAEALRVAHVLGRINALGGLDDAVSTKMGASARSASAIASLGRESTSKVLPSWTGV